MTKWYMLPGMGANTTMYDSLLKEVTFEINVINWPQYSGEQTYTDVARRIIKENDIRNGDVVVGSSLGGMVSLEIAQYKKLAAVVLIGSAIRAKEVQGFLILLSPLAALTPISLIQILVGKHTNIISKMFVEADDEFVRAMCTYLNTWPGYHGSQAKLFRLHGQKDHIIPCPKEGCEIVPNAGHLLAITHPKECGMFLNKINNSLPKA
jgi:pimeloyl-ACP methyl ester carboxylesterase